MIVVMQKGYTEEQLKRVIHKVHEKDFQTNTNRGVHRTVIAVLGNGRPDREDVMEMIRSFPGVEEVKAILKPFKLVSRDFRSDNTVVDADGVLFGGNQVQIIGGPCAAESKEVLLEIADNIEPAGANLFRAGAYKPRTSPYSFQGWGEEALKWLAEVRAKTGKKIVTEVMDTSEVELVAEYADIIQVGTRNMQNFRLLTAVGQIPSKKPIILKRGLSATIKEWLMSAEYIAAAGNPNIILCERGIRTFESETRNTLDVSAVPILKRLTHLPVIVDPSHAAGRRDIIPELSYAAIAAGADGLLVEVHVRPEEAMSDGPQSLLPEAFNEMVENCRKIAAVFGRTM